MRRTRIRLAAVGAILLVSQFGAGVPTALAAAPPTISDILIPATIRPGETLTMSWRVVAPAGLDTIVTDTLGTAPGTWARIGGPPGWITWCPFTMYTTRVSGTATDGRYETSCVLPAALPNGVYSVFISALDVEGQRAENNGADTFTVVGGSDDASPPTVSEVTVSPALPVAGEAITIAWRARDETGVAGVIPWAFGPNGRLTDDAGALWLGYDTGVLVSGDERDGRYEVTLPVSANAAPGTYVIWFSVRDVLGNREASLYPDGFGSVYATYEIAASATGVAGIPTAVTAQMAPASTARLTFAQPPVGADPIIDYDVRYSTEPTFAAGGTFVEAGTTTTASVDVTGLRGGASYYFQVRAQNRSGHGSWSATSNVLVMPASRPSAVTGVSAARLSSSRIRVSFAPAADGGSPILDYDIQYSTSPTFARAVIFVEGGTSTSTAMEVAGLRRATTYYVRVRATNAMGDSVWSSAAVVRT